MKFLITPSEDWLSVFADFLQTWIGDEYGQRLMKIPSVVVAPDGSVVPRQCGGRGPLTSRESLIVEFCSDLSENVEC